MFFESTPQSRRFLLLASKAAANTATKEEREELRSMTRNDRELEKELRTMRLEARQEAEGDFTALFLRVLFGTASQDEVSLVENLPSTNPEQWVAFQHLRFALEELSAPASAGTPEGGATDTGIERIRELVLSRLKPR